MTETVDTVVFVCQILMIIAICIFRNRGSKKLCITPLIIMAVVCYLLYVASWIAYYNGIALLPISIFTICHMIYGVVNFII